MEKISITIEIPAHDAIWLSKLLALVNESKENIPQDKHEEAKAKVKEIKELIEKFDLFFDFYSPSPNKDNNYDSFTGFGFAPGNNRV